MRCGLRAPASGCGTILSEKRLYITGGLGPSWTNEGFTRDYDLPNETAYAETCAAVGLVFWAHRMLLMTGESRYADVMERALYNGVLSGISLHGDRFFYENRLAWRGGSNDGTGIAAPAARRISLVWSPRSATMSPLSRRANCLCTSMVRVGWRQSSMAPR